MLTAGLAGCSGSDRGATATEADSDGTATGTQDPATGADTQTPTEGPTTTGTSTPTPTETPTPTPTPTEAPPESVDVTIDNQGFSAWVVSKDGSGSVAPIDESNPTMTFEVGVRYVIENNGWSAHPFALRRADDTPLLSQSAGGEFEGNAAVAWRDDGGTVAFTMTRGLADELDYYICTVHRSMRGDATANG